MSPVKNGRFALNEYATGYPEPGKTMLYDESQSIDLDNVALNGGTLVKTTYWSIDPWIRFRMSDPKVQKNFPVFKPGETITNHGLGVVLRSENPSFKPGDHVSGMLPAQEYSVLPVKGPPLRVIKNTENIPWSVYVGVVGMPGLTAYAGWKTYTKPKAGDTVFVTTAGGPVGATVVQLAKRDGFRVIATAGTQAKVDFVKSCGADVAFNYKEEKIRDVLVREGPINIFWDHLGGDVFDAVLENAAIGATFIVCGSIPSYNGVPHPIMKHAYIFERNITIYGFRVIDVDAPWIEMFYKEMPKLIAEGEMKYREHVIKGFKGAPQGLLDVLMGRNEGKSVIEVAKE